MIGLSLGLTLALESPVALVWCRVTKKPARNILLTALIANVLTQTALWVLLWFLVRPYWMVLLVAEIGIWAIESLVLQALPSNQLRLAEAMRLSLWMNLISFGLGLVLPV